MATSLARRLTALQYPHTNDDFGDLPAAQRLIVWLEDRYIRHLTVAARVPLRSGTPSALEYYLHEVVAPDWVMEYYREASYHNVCSWLVNLALQYEYEATVSAATAPPALTLEDEDLRALAAAFHVPPASHVVGTLQAVIKAARARPRPPPPSTTAPAPKRMAPSATSGKMASQAHESPSVDTFPLGFEGSGKQAVDDAMRVLRLMHVRQLRELQDRVNEMIVCMQEVTRGTRD